jgi:hypothetical protein
LGLFRLAAALPFSLTLDSALFEIPLDMEIPGFYIDTSLFADSR